MADGRAQGTLAQPSMRYGDRSPSATGSLFVSLRPHLVVGSAYVLLTAVTTPFFMGDTIGYADAIAERRFTDFGHYGWYWLGHASAALLMPVTRQIVGPSLPTNIALSLVFLSWVTGLMSVLLMRALVFHVTKRQGAAYAAAFGLLVSQSFLNFTQSGCSYTFGMSFLLLGIWLLVTRDEARTRTALLAGTALFVAVAVWFTYVFSIPAALLAPAALRGLTRRRLVMAVQTGLVLSVLLLVTFGAAGYSLGVRTVDDGRRWITDAAHGVRGMDGVPRMVLGLGRSFIDTGNDGPMMKAYLSKDPYNPVGLADIVRGSLWKLALFYAFVATIVVNLARSLDGGRVLALLALNAVPVIGFAIVWQGAAIERYLLMYPVFFLAFGYSIASVHAVRPLKFAAVLFVAVMTAVNLGVMAAPVQAAREQAALARIRPLEPHLRAESIVATVTQQDQVWAFRWTFPFNPINADGRLSVYHLVEPGTDQALAWQAIFARHALAAWANGGDVWVSNRTRSERPKREWRWIEGDDPAVSWTDVTSFFSTLDMGPLAGGEDGFRMLLPTPQNQALLQNLVSRAERGSEP
jgi:hypothetical protein